MTFRGIVEIKFILLILFCTATANVFSQNLPEDETMLIGKLENGLSYYIDTNDNPENQIELRLVINVGSLYEEESEQGFAHFVEHMCFNGTKNFPGNQVIDYLETKGLRFGRHFNALTSFAETKFMLSLSNPDDELLNNGFQILEDWAHQVSFEDIEIEKETGVIIQELRTGLGAESRLRDQYYPAIFRGARYQYRLPIGKKDILESFKPDELREFYYKWYRPERMAVIVAGNIDREKALALVESHFAHIRNDHPKGKTPSFEVTNNTNPVFKVCTDSEVSKELVRIYYVDDPGKMNTYEDLKTGLIEDLITGMIAKRFQKINQSVKSPFIYSTSAIGYLVRTKDAFSFTGTAKPGKVTEALELLLRENRRLYLHGFSASELELEKKLIAKKLATQAAKKDDTKRIANSLMDTYLKQETATKAEFIFHETMDILPEIGLIEVNKLLEYWLAKKPIIIAQSIDQEIVSEFQNGGMETLYNELVASNPEKYILKESKNSLETEDVKSGTIVSEEILGDYNITKWTLSNGARVILKPTGFENDKVYFSSISIGGFSQYTGDDLVSASLSTRVAFMSGLDGMNFQELRTLKHINGVNIGTWMNEYSEGTKGYSDSEGIESLLSLNYLYFNKLKADSLTTEAYLSRMKSQTDAMKNEPDYVFRDTLYKTLYGANSRRFVLSDTENYKKFDLKLANKIARERFEDPSGFTFIMVGSFDIDEVREPIEKYIGGMKGISKEETIPQEEYITLKESKDITIYSGKAEKSMVDMMFFGELPWTIENRATTTVMTEVLKIELRKALREEKSGVYGISVSSEANIVPDNYFKFEVFFQCATHLVEPLVDEVYRQLELIKTEGPDQETIEKVRSVLNAEYSQSIKKNKYWQDELVDVFGWDKDIDNELSEFIPAVMAVDAKDIQKLAKQKLKRSHVLLTKMYPEVASNDPVTVKKPE